MNPVQYLMDHGLQLNTNQHQMSHSFTATKHSLEVIQNWRRSQMRENFKRQQSYRYLEQPFFLVPSSKLVHNEISSRGHQTTFVTKLSRNEHNSTVQNTSDAFFKHDNSVATADKYLTTSYELRNLSQPDSATPNVSSAIESVGLSAVGSLRKNGTTLRLCERSGDDNSLSTKNITSLAKLSDSTDQDDNKFGGLDRAFPGLPLYVRRAVEETKSMTRHETQVYQNRQSTFLQELRIILKEGDFKKKTATQEMIDRIRRLCQSLGLDHAHSNVTTEPHQLINTDAQLKSPQGIDKSKSLSVMEGVPNQLACSVKVDIDVGKQDTTKSTVSNTASDGRRRKQTQMLLQKQEHLAQLVEKQRFLEAERKHLENMKLSKMKHAKKTVLSCYQDNRRKQNKGDPKTPRPIDESFYKSHVDDIESFQLLRRRSVGKAIREKDSHMGMLTSRSSTLTSRSGMLTSRSGMLTSRSGMLTSRSGMLTSRSGMLTSRSGNLDNAKQHNNILRSAKSLEIYPPHTNRLSRSGQFTSRRKCSTLEEWKRCNGVPESSKVFIVIGGYSDIIKALVRRNWVENPDQHSQFFDLIWTLRSKDIPVAALNDKQITNHFCRNTEITTKVGLLYNLGSLRLREDVDIDTFFPRCFDIWDDSNLNEFIHTYKCLKAASILKLYISQKKKKDRERQQLVGSMVSASVKQPGKDAIENPTNDFCKSVIRTALSICQRQLQDIGDLIDHPTDAEDYASVMDHEWDILAQVNLSNPNKILPPHRREPAYLHRTKLKAFVKRRRERERRTTIRKKESGNKTVVIIKKNSTTTANQKGLGIHEPFHKRAPIPDNCSPHDLANNEDSETEAVLQVLEQMNRRYPQYAMNGNRNLWIIKPAGMSRGRGIQLMSSLDDILEKIRNRQAQWVCQKYIENPQIILGRKFDIRQWILVTDWNPLTIWFYNDSYLRFCADEYSTQNCDNLFAHLTNNSMAKNSENFEHSPIEGCMWTSDQYAAYLEEHSQQKNLWKTVIQPAIKKIVYLSLSSAQDVIEQRKNSCELYGYDLMVDENFNTWLLEINSSPSMDYSTKVTTSLVKQVLEDCIKVIVDYYDAPLNKRHNVDTGKFLLMHKSKQIITKPPGALALSFTIQGKLLSLDKVRGF